MSNLTYDDLIEAGLSERDRILTENDNLKQELETTKKQLKEAVRLLDMASTLLESEGYDFFQDIKKFLEKLSREDA